MRNNLTEIISKANEIHNSKYDYSLIKEYKNNRTKYPIICPEHGVFYKDFYHHIDRKCGCTKCSKKFRYDNKSFIETASKLMNMEACSFEKTDYKNNKTKIIVTCHKKDENGYEHGDFLIAPGHILSGEGCPKCRYIKSSAKNRKTISEIVEKANSVHNWRYDYSLIKDYKNGSVKYPIICREHGVFLQSMNNHINGKQGCPVCGRIRCDSERCLSTEEWIEKAKNVHKNKYDYSKSEYKTGKSKIKIICPIHDEFEQIARNHIFGAGCPKCFKDKSYVEKELFDYIKSILPNTEIIENSRCVIPPKEIDVYIPSLKIGFEMNGLIWHSEKFNEDSKYHINKTNDCLKNGIRLIQIYDDEWLLKNEICKSRIKNILGLTDKKIYARNCSIQEISSSDASLFLSKNHIQGKTQSSVRVGLFYNEELVSVMTFSKNRVNLGGRSKSGEYELIRFANLLNTNVVGGASKMFSYFIKKYNPISVKSFADKRWSNGDLYEKLGFKFIEETKPSYFYVVNKKRVNRFNLRKDILVEKYGCPGNKTEKEFCDEMGWYRIYDCGTRKYIWKDTYQ